MTYFTMDLSWNYNFKFIWPIAGQIVIGLEDIHVGNLIFRPQRCHSGQGNKPVHWFSYQRKACIMASEGIYITKINVQYHCKDADFVVTTT